ncbi:MAG TPA: 2-amino-4-hydroxy-6-hydroxymethyldihydropteridine diphosphokinase [Lacipirellula sp.]
MAFALIALGSNLGDRAAQLRQAVDALAKLPQTHLLARSRWHETAPVGGAAGQGPFLNAAALLSTSLSPAELLRRLSAIESERGRKRDERWSARTLDLDLLLYDELVIDSAELTIPHPRMVYRPFILAPAAEVAPWMLHAESGWTVGGLLRHLQEAPPSIGVAGDADAVKQVAGKINGWLASAVSNGSHVAEEPPTVSPWRIADRHPRLLLAADAPAGIEKRRLRKIFNLPTTGPVAWISAETTSPELDEALAAVRAVWPAYAR